MLQQDDYSVQEIIKRSNVKVICTTDDPTDDLHYHEQIANLPDFPVKVLPTFRPDKGLEINKDTFIPFVKQLEEVTNKSFSSFEEYVQALEGRVQYFHEKGCRVSDHGLAEIPFAKFEHSELDAIFQAGRNGQEVSKVDENKFKTAILMVLAKATKKEIGQCKSTLERFVIIIRECLRNLVQMLVLIRSVTKGKWLHH